MEETVEFDIKELLSVLIKKAWIIILCAVLVSTAVLVYTANFVQPLYSAEVTLYVNNNSSQNSTAISSSDLAVALRLVATYVNIVESDMVLEKVIEETGIMLTSAQVRSMLSAEPVGETEMFVVRITSPDPQMSADLVNAIAEVAPARISAVIEGSSAKVIDYARVPKSRSFPNYTTNTIVGALVGAVAAIAVILLQARLDNRIKKEEDLTNLFNIPVLGRIPDLDDAQEQANKKARR